MSLITERRRFHLSLVMLILVLGAITATGISQVKESRSSRAELVLAGNLEAAKTTAEGVEATLSARRATVQGIARREDLAGYVQSNRWEEVPAYVKALRQIDPGLNAAGILDATGHLRVIDPPDPSIVGKVFLFRDYFKGAINKRTAFVSNVFTRAGTPRLTVFAVAAAVRDPTGEVIGVLVAIVPVDLIGKVHNDVPIPNQGSLAIFDRTGRPIGDGKQDVVASSPSGFLAMALSGHSGSGEGEVKGLSGSRLVGYAPVRNVGWAVMVEQPESIVFKPVVKLVERLILIGLLIAVMILAAWVMLTGLLRQLSEQRNRTAAIVSSIADGVITIDDEGLIDSVNPAALQLIGRTSAEVKGRPYENVFTLVRVPVGRPEKGERSLGKAPFASPYQRILGGQATLASATGKTTPVTVSAAPIFDTLGMNHGGVAVIRDVTFEREADRMKSAFVSTVSHELRTPLTMIQGFSELLLSGDLNGERGTEAIQQIHNAAERLARLIDDLLSVSRIESGKVVLRTESIDVAELVAEVVKPFGYEKTFELNLPARSPIALADRDKLIQIFTNLFSNATKYSSPQSSVEVSVEEVGAEIQVSVTDHGIGLTEQDQSNLFDLFFRVERPEVSMVRGTGLGLFITKSLVEMQGGRIWVTSNANEGTTFFFTLPMAVSIAGDGYAKQAVNS